MNNLRKTLKKGEGEIPDALSISPKLMNAINAETVKKTGAKLLTNKELGTWLKEASIVGTIGGSLLKFTESLMSGDNAGAVLSLAGGVVSILAVSNMPVLALGTAAAAIVAAVILKKKQEAKTAPLKQGGKTCIR